MRQLAALAAGLPLALAAGCSSDTTNPSSSGTASTVVCGAGTKLDNGTCVPSSSTECGAGTKLEGGQCVPTSVTECGAGTKLEDGKCVPTSDLACGDGTTEVDGACVPTGLEPGNFTAPLVHLQRVWNAKSNHMHLDEVRYRESDKKLFVCSYTFEVLKADDPGNMSYISGANGLKVVIPADGHRNNSYATGTRTGGCINLSWDDTDNNVVYTTHKGNIDDPAYVGGWRLTPSGSSLVATQLPMLQEPGVSYEGIDVVNGKIFVALHEGGLGVFERNPADDKLSRIGTLTGLENAIAVRVSGTTAYIANGLGGLAIVDVSDPTNPMLLGQVVTGGQARDVRVNGNYVYLAAGSAGLIAVDVSDPTNPTVVGSANMPGSAIRLDYNQDRVYVAGWNDARVYDVSTPSTPVFLGAGRVTEQLAGTTTEDQDGRPEVTNRILGIAGYGDSVFVGAWHVPHGFRLHADRKAPYMYLPENLNLLDFGPVAVGDTATSNFEVYNQGTAPLTVTNTWTANSAFTVTPKQVRIDPGGSAPMQLTYTATTTDKETSVLNFSSDDPSYPLRKGWLVGNEAGLGVGSPLPETNVSLTDGGEWKSTEHVGQVTMLSYFATF